MLMNGRNDSTIRKSHGRPRPLPPCMRRVAMQHFAGQLGVAWAVLSMPAADAATPIWHGAPLHYAVTGAPRSEAAHRCPMCCATCWPSKA
jgi:type III secretion protein C